MMHKMACLSFVLFALTACDPAANDTALTGEDIPGTPPALTAPTNALKPQHGASPSLTRLRVAAANGNAQAQFHLGLAYAEGNGIEPDAQQALRLWRSSTKLCGKKSPCQILPPVDLRCRDGERFTIVFLTRREAAYLFLPNNRVERLVNDALAGGIGFSGKQHSFEEHGKNTTLVTFGTKTEQTVCHRAQ